MQMLSSRILVAKKRVKLWRNCTIIDAIGVNERVTKAIKIVELGGEIDGKGCNK